MGIPFVDLKSQMNRIEGALRANMDAVLGHCQFVNGPEIARLEQELAAFCGAKHAIGCASGTDALLMALMAKDVGPGDAVFVPAFTFYATAEVVSLLGATPVFVDIDPVTYNMDPVSLERAIRALSENNPGLHPLPQVAGLTPRGIIAVDLYGQAAHYPALVAMAKKYGLFLVEDAAQSFGGEQNGRKCCSFGDIACTSFFPAKPLGGYGDGGMCFTDDEGLDEILRSLRNHGMGRERYEHVRLGLNGRLDTLQAAILLAKFTIFPEEIGLRQAVADRYNALFQDAPGLGLPTVLRGNRSAWAQYTLLADTPERRTAIMDRLKTAGIPVAIHYPMPLHRQPVFAPLGYGPGSLPVCEDAAQRVFSLPMHPYLSADDQTTVAKAVKGA
jgi:dTDP-4-amino-4,6-dideoxygalactose transaminase